MSADLIAAFFDRDLTNEEDEALARLLSDSMDESVRFADEAARFYASLALPEPQWPGGLPPSALGGLSGLGGIAAGLVGSLIIGGAIGWRLSVRPLTIEFAPPPEPLATEQGIQEEAPAPPAAAAPAVPAPAVPAPAKPAAAHAARKAPAASQPVAAVAGGPATGPEKYATGNELTIKVDLKEASSVAVDVYDSAGALVRQLGAGHYPAGIHRFPWDGKDASGLPVKPGRYRVLLTTGEKVMEQWLVINAKP